MKKHLVTLFIGLVLFLVGIACFYIETINYKVSSNLTPNFKIEQKTLDYEISNKETFRITNDGTNKNINLYVDNTLSDKVRIVVEYADILKIDSNYNTKVYKDEKVINIDIESDLLLDFNNIDDLYSLAIDGLNNKTIYNYTLLKYPETKVYVNEKYKTNIEFVDKYGKEYSAVK